MFFHLSAGDIISDILKKDAEPEGFKPFLRIGILAQAASCTVEGDAQVLLPDGTAGGSIQGGYEITPKGVDSIVVGEETYLAAKLVFKPKFSFMSIGPRIFRGTVEVINSGGKLTVVNVLGIEDYVRGVVNREILPDWPLEAKKVQAVLARTYALYQKINKPRSELYDLEPTVLDQVYGGLNKEDLTANQAVAETAGEIISKDNLPAEIYFYSTCGGKTASSADVWGKEVAYLKAVSCAFCKKSPLFRWRRVLKAADVAAKLKSAGYTISEIDNIALEKAPGGRVKVLVINSTRVEVNAFRRAVGFSVVWSNDFELKLSKGSLHFSGKGAGHGVGACQWGMSEQARQGKTYKPILDYYFPGTEIKKLY